MSLNRYNNAKDIQNLTHPKFGDVYRYEDLEHMKWNVLYPIFTGDVSNINDIVLSELHMYTFNGDHVGSSYNIPVWRESESNSLLTDLRAGFKLANIDRGSYKIVLNLISPIFGRPGNKNKSGAWPTLIKEISPDRTELKMGLRDPNAKLALQQFRELTSALSNLDLVNNIVVNFGDNQIYKILKIKQFKFDKLDQNVFYIKLYRSLDLIVQDRSKAFFGVELADPRIDTVILDTVSGNGDLNTLKGPNFYLDVDDYNSQATVYKSWTDLLDSNVATSQQIIDTIISGSGEVTLNIDYTDFENYIFYSSAEERVRNFKYKMQLMETYSLDNSLMIASSGSGSHFIASPINANIQRIDNIKSAFDPFERWMYYHDTGSIFTHGLSGSLTPWPKYIDDGRYINHDVTSSIVTDWFVSTIEEASTFDQTNEKSLWYSIPEHVLMDDSNSNYVTFVNMVGQHFDVMYMYINALTQIHERDEHPERGPSNNLLFHIAKSFGWDLKNARSLTDLWLYKLGANQIGQQVTSSGMTIRSHEDQTQMIWRRVVNNLPYLLKTKGTSRSVKAMMSIYGIPQTLISIKEYGGPGLDSDRPIAIEDTFAYSLEVDTGSYVSIPQDEVDAAWYGWGSGAWCGSTGSADTRLRTPDTYEFRFRTKQSGSLGAIPLYIQSNGVSDPKYAISLVSANELTSTASFSGSDDYGKVMIEQFGTGAQVAYSDWLPIFDGDFWTIRTYNENGVSGSVLDNRIHIARALDGLYGRISQESAVSMSSAAYTISTASLGGAPTATITALNSSTGGAHTYNTEPYSGSVQGYKEYYTIYDNSTFYNHVKNPRSYNVDSSTGSFYSLYRYIPFGLDLQREDHTTTLYASSSHPDQSGQVPSLIEYVGFTGNQTTQYDLVNETMYSEVPKVAGVTVRSDKIRIEDSSLQYQLDPATRSETSEYDRKPIDSNRLAVVFSLADQVNRDIYNHMGFEDLDSWFGCPTSEFENDYPILRSKAAEYFQKYQQFNDINAFIRILSLYDYTFFEQIKQLAPGRADLITGILLDPPILQRNKTILSRLPEVSNPQWEQTITYEVSQSGLNPQWDTIVDHTSSVDIGYFYKTGSIELNLPPSIEYSYYTSSLIDPCIFEITKQPEYTASLQIIDSYSQNTSSICDIIDSPVPDCRYTRKICHYDGYRLSDSLFTNALLTTQDGWYTSSNFLIVSESGVSNIDSNRFIRGHRILVNDYISQSIDTVSQSRYIVRLFSHPYDTASLDAKVRLVVNGSEQDYRKLYYKQSGSLEWVNEYRMEFIGTGVDSIRIKAEGDDITLYSLECHPYLTKWQESWKANAYEVLNQPSYCETETWYYQIDECSARNKSRFIGSRLVGAGINIDSTATIDGGPVVTIFETNPNQSGDDSSPEGNLRLE